MNNVRCVMFRKTARGGACALIAGLALVAGGCSAQDWEKLQTRTSQLTGELSKLGSAFQALAPKKSKAHAPADVATPDAFTAGEAQTPAAQFGTPTVPAMPPAAPPAGGFLSRHRRPTPAPAATSAGALLAT
jgi:outer membrane murein-binding lipoprotein Lpp